MILENNFLKELLKDLVFPKHCPICLEALPPGNQLICDPCRKKVARIYPPVCLKCGRPMDPENAAKSTVCESCRRLKPGFVKGLSYAEYSSYYIKRLILEVKYHNGRQLLDYPAKDFAYRIRNEVPRWNAEVMIPVPVHESRLLKRGYNQAAELAMRLSESLGIPVDTEYLARNEKTTAMKELSSAERYINLVRVFHVKGRPGKYQRVILVDDIYTTGSTACACTEVLRRSGVQEVYVLTLAAVRSR